MKPNNRLAVAVVSVAVLAFAVISARTQTAESTVQSEAAETKEQSATKGLDKYYPGTEKIGANEMRIVACGTGMPAQRRSQAATCFLVELGNGDKFLFDIGTGSGANIASLGIPYDDLDKLFISHLHSDHVGDLDALWIGGWTGGRHGALQVWGPSGQTPEFGTKHFIEKTKEAYKWDYTGRLGVIPTRGGDLVVHEFDYKQENRIVYEMNGVTIRSWPAIHAIDGCVSYSLEWKGLKFVFGGDTVPNMWFDKYAKNADLAIHECFMTPTLLMKKYGFSAHTALLVATEVHTPPAGFGIVMSRIKPRMAVAYHFFNDYDTRYPIYEGIRRYYKGPLTMATDLIVWNVTKENIRVREVIVDDASWPAKSSTPPDQPDRKLKTPFTQFVDQGKMDVTKQLQPLIDSFKKENGLK